MLGEDEDSTVVADGKLNLVLFFNEFIFYRCFSFSMCCSIDFHPLFEQSKSSVLHNMQTNAVSDDPCLNHDLTDLPFSPCLSGHDQLNFVL